MRATLGHTRYYKKFIKIYVQITVPMEKLLKKYVTFLWNEECQKSLDTLKEKMIIVPILVFPYCNKEFHVDVDVSCMDLGVVVAQPGVREIDHLIAFASRKLSKEEKNYTTMEREGLAMVYALQEFMHYFLWEHFKMLYSSLIGSIYLNPSDGSNGTMTLILFLSNIVCLLFNLMIAMSEHSQSNPSNAG